MVMIIMLPMWMNFLLRTYAWMTLLEDNGLINQFFRLLGLLGPEESLHMINTNGAVVLGMVYNFLPFMVLPLYSVMTKIDSRVIEAAQDLGSNGFQVLLRVILPLSVPGILSGITMVFVPAVSTFVITKLLGGSKVLLIGDAIETMFIGQGANYNVGAALSLVLSMTLRFVPLFRRQLEVVRQAQFCIGRDASCGSVWQRVRRAVTIFSIMVTWALENAIETADSMKSRGYGLRGRTAFSIYRMEARDRYALAWLGFCGLYLLCGCLAGGLKWWYFPLLQGVMTQPFSISFYLAYLALCLTPVILDRREARAWRCSPSKT